MGKYSSSSKSGKSKSGRSKKEPKPGPLDMVGPDGRIIHSAKMTGGTGAEASGCRGGHVDTTGNAAIRGGHAPGGGWGEHKGSKDISTPTDDAWKKR